MYEIRAIPMLLKIIKTEPRYWITWSNAAYALGKLRVREAVPQLIALLECDWPETRMKSAEALGRLQDLSAVEALVNALDDKNEEVRRYAASAIGQIARVHPDASVIKSAIPSLLAALACPLYAPLRVATAKALGEIGEESAGEFLLPHLQDKDEELCIAVAVALGRIHYLPAIEPLRALLTSQHDTLRASAIMGLAYLQAITIEELRQYRATFIGQYSSLSATVEALGVLKDRNAIEELHQLFFVKEHGINLDAARTLSWLGEDYPVEIWVDEIQTNSGLAIAYKFGELCDYKLFRVLIELLLSLDLYTRRNIVEALTDATGMVFGHRYDLWKNWIDSVDSRIC